MDLEEQRLRQRIAVRETALKDKVEVLKARLQQLKSMGDVKFQVKERPVLMLTGSVLAGFLTKKLLGGKNRHSRHGYYSRPAPRAAESGHLWASVSAIISAIIIRAGTAVITEIIKKPTPRDRTR